MDNAIIKTYGKFVNQLEDHKVADAKQIYDEEYIGVFPKSGATKGWYQNDINKHIVTNIEALDTELATKIASVKSGLDGDLEKEVAARKAADDKINDTLNMITDGNYEPTFGGAYIGGDVEIGVPASLYYSSDTYSPTYTTSAEAGQNGGWIKFPAGWFHHLVVSDNEFNAKTIIDPRSITFSTTDDDSTTEGRMYAYNGRLVLSPYDDGAYDDTLNPNGGIAVSNLASKEYVENKIKVAKEDVENKIKAATIDTTNFATVNYVDSKAHTLTSQINAVDKKIPSTAGLATTKYVNDTIDSKIEGLTYLTLNDSTTGVIPSTNNVQLNYVSKHNLVNTPIAMTIPSATNALAGVMSSADKKKLDNAVSSIEANTNNIKANAAAIKDVADSVKNTKVIKIPDAWGDGVTETVYNELTNNRPISINLNFDIATTTGSSELAQHNITGIEAIMYPSSFTADAKRYDLVTVVSSNIVEIHAVITSNYTVTVTAYSLSKDANVSILTLGSKNPSVIAGEGTSV